LTGLVNLWKERGIRCRILLMVWVSLHGVVNFSRCRLLRGFYGALIHFLLCLLVDGVIFGAMVGLTTVIHAVRRSECVRASTLTVASAY
jgi:hypothetical protein